MSAKPTWVTYHWIKKQRRRKKWKIYKQALSLSFDKTIFIYTVVFGVWLFFMIYDWMKQYGPYLAEVEDIIRAELFLFALGLLARSITASSLRPGIRFTSAELHLSMLPHSRKKLLGIIALQHTVYHAIMGYLILILIGIITPVSLFLTFQAATIYSAMTAAGLLLQWKYFSLTTRKKILLIPASFILLGAWRLGIAGHIPPVMNWTMLGGMLILVNILLAGRILNGINWSKVIQYNDAAEWNIWFVQQVTKVEIKPPKKLGWTQQLFRTKKAKLPFPSSDRMYHRLWRIYLAESKEFILKTIGICCLFPLAAVFIDERVAGIAVPLVVFVYIKMSASLFGNMFINDKLIFSLPWNKEKLQGTYMKWAMGGFILPFLIIMVVYSMKNEIIWWLPVQMAGIGSWFYLFLHYEMKQQWVLLQRYGDPPGIVQGTLLTIGFILAGLAVVYPYSSIGVILLFVISTNIRGGIKN